MLITAFGLPAGKIFWGSVLLIVCFLFYLLWWIVVFRPEISRGLAAFAGPIIAAIVFGMAGMILTLWGITTMPSENLPVSNLVFLIGGVAGCFLLLALTKRLFKRPVTSELFLIVGWTALELSVINVLYGSNFLSPASASVFWGLIGAAALISLVNYTVYYRLKDKASYIAGMIPLILAAAVMIILVAALML